MPEQLLDRVLREIRERLDASRDAYEESRRLEAALSALGPASASEPPEPPRRRAQVRRAASARAPRGENLRRIREALAERPGASAGELESVTGIARPTLASTLAKLTREGEIERSDLPSGSAGYRLRRAETPEAATETPPEADPIEADAEHSAEPDSTV